MEKITLSTGKLCPKCGCNSLEIGYSEETIMRDKNYHCVAGCGMEFALHKLKSGKIKIFYNEPNEKYLQERFKFLPEGAKKRKQKLDG